MKKYFSLLIIAIMGSTQSLAQVGIGTETPHASSILHLNSTNKGLLIPNVALQNNTDTSTISSPANSLIVFNTSSLNGLTAGFYYWYDNQWNRLQNGSGTTGGSGTGWSLSGNTTGSADFLGTNNYQNLVFKTNGTQIGKFVPNGGISIGRGASANENQSIAIGENANATNQVQATAIGYNSNASGYQSIALGHGARSSQNSATAIGFNSNAAGENSSAIGYGTTSSGQYSTAIGYQASTSQSNAIVLGNSLNTNNKIGIGTNTPDERLHVVGKVKIVDGSQANGYVLTSDANGVATWKAPDDATNIAYAQIHKNSNENLQANNGIAFGTSGEVHNLNIASNYIQTQTKTGIYRVTYTVSVRKNSGSQINPEFYLTLQGSEVAGTRTFVSVANTETQTVTMTKLVNIPFTYQSLAIKSNLNDNTTSVLAGGTSLLVEFVR